MRRAWCMRGSGVRGRSENFVDGRVECVVSYGPQSHCTDRFPRWFLATPKRAKCAKSLTGGTHAHVVPICLLRFGVGGFGLRAFSGGPDTCADHVLFDGGGRGVLDPSDRKWGRGPVAFVLG